MKKLVIVMGAAVLTTTLAATHPTLFDLKSQCNPDGSVADVIEILAQHHEVLDDIVMLEGNLTTGHMGSVRTGICEPAFVKLYGRTQPQKSGYVHITDNCGMMEAFPEVSARLAGMSGDVKKFRRNEEMAHIEGFYQKAARYIFMGNEATEPEGFTGLAPRFNDQSAENGANIITDAATPDGNDNGSLWLIVWGPNTVHGIYPKGSKAGLTYEDKGLVTSENSDGLMDVYRSKMQWDLGIHVKDWRYISRGQVDVENLTKNAATGPDLLDIMAQMIDCIPNINAGRAAFYANRTMRSFMRRQIMNKTVNSTLSIDQLTRPNGALIRQIAFDGIPVRRVDQLLNTETGI
jgi:hypothetical protein